MPTDRTFTDQINRAVVISGVPQRIISIVPSQTELIFHLGLEERVVGITKFCIHPAEKVARFTKVGGTKKLDIELIKSLTPDLIIANKEENERIEVEELMQYFPVWVSNIDGLPSALEMIKSIGELTNTVNAANNIASKIQQSFDQLNAVNNLSVAYMIWRKPYMMAGQGTFINDLLKRCGLVNVSPNSRYPEIKTEQLVELNPQLIFLSSEPYPFMQKHVSELQLHLPNSKIYLVDGEMFSWYGSRLLHAPAYFKQLMESIVG